jgi:aminoglycoside phosphotransferase (APT) family kinase protein
MMRREAEIAACLPPGAPAPALLHVIDDDDWIVLVFEDVDGALPHTPWERRELDRVIDATLRLGRLAPRAPLHSVVDQYGQMFVGWRNLAGEGPAAVDDPWCRDRLDELAAAEARWESACAGDQLIHGDVRSDNVLLTRDNRVVFVDWTATCIGAGWFDVLVMLPVVELEGGGQPEAVMERSGLGDLDRDQVVPLVAAVAGYFADRGRLPDPPGLPTLRAFQRAQGEVALGWLRRAWDTG